MKCVGSSLLAACGSPPLAHRPDAPGDATAADAERTRSRSPRTVDSTRFVVREHMLAAGEMQISGEPLAEAMGRDLGGYSRDVLPPDLYTDPMLGVS